MEFLDNQIAELQKIRKIRNKNKCIEQKDEILKDIRECSLNQDEVNLAILNGQLCYENVRLEFENEKCFDETISISIIKNFFDVCEEKYLGYFWYREDKLSIILNKFNLTESIHVGSVDKLNELLKSTYKNEEVYIECLNKSQENNHKYKRYILNYRMPTAFGYMLQYIYYIELDNDAIVLLGMVRENEKEIWKKIIQGMADSLKFNIGDK